MKKQTLFSLIPVWVFAALFLLYAVQSIGADERPCNWTSLKLDEAGSANSQKILAGATALNPDKLPDGKSLFRLQQTIQDGIYVYDFSPISKESGYADILPPVNFANALFTDPKTGSLVVAMLNYSTLATFWYIDIPNRKQCLRELYGEGSGQEAKILDIKRQYDRELVSLKLLQIQTLRGSGLVAQGAVPYEQKEQNTNGTIVWEGVSFERSVYIAVLQENDWPKSYKIPIPGKPEIRIRIYKFIIVFYPDRAALAAALDPASVYQDGYSIIDGYSRDGFDRNGYDRAGYDKTGWSGRSRFMGKIQNIADGSAAMKAGLKKGDFIQAADGKPFLGPLSLIAIVSSRKPGETIPITVKAGPGPARDIPVVLGPRPDNAASGYLGAAVEMIEIGTANPENRAKETWSGSIRNGRQGWGVLTQADGGRYIGNYADDRPDGTGLRISSSGKPRIEEWKDGKLLSSKEPAGSIVSEIYSWIYLGSAVSKGYANGRGDAITSDGNNRIENGRFASGRLVEGKMIMRDGTEYSGTFADDLLVTGTIIDNNGSRYEGALAKGLPEGSGKIVTADSTTYTGTFHNGLYDGEGTITRPDGEKYEGRFRNGLPHGQGIYFNGTAIERCEYYDGQRIDQAYQIKTENEKQLEALRQERERIAEERADQAEQQRISAERASVAQKATSEKSSNNLIAGVFGIGTAIAGKGIGLSTADSALLGYRAAADVQKGDANMSGMKSAGQTILDSRNGNVAGNPTASVSNQGRTTGAVSGKNSYRKLPSGFIDFNGKSNDTVTADIGASFLGRYSHADGESWFELKEGGFGSIHYYQSPTTMPMHWAVQLTKDGAMYYSGGTYMRLFIVIKGEDLGKGKRTGVDDQAELLDLDAKGAGMWSKR